MKCNLSARITPRLVQFTWLKPWMITVGSSLIGVLAGIVFALGWGFTAGLLAAASQILDGVDGQFARLTNRQSNAGAFLDSVLDRYSDGVLVIGLITFNFWLGVSVWLLWALGALALIGSGLISYSSARADSLSISLGKPTLASKGTRTTVTAVSGMLSPLFPFMPMAALCYLVVHTHLVVLYRIGLVFRQPSEGKMPS
jgi:phosphatidylglycerophosphate synthase